MVDFYRDLIESENCEVEFVFSNSAKDILKYTKDVLSEDKFLIKSGTKKSYGLELRKVIKHIKKCGAKCTTVLDKATIIVDSLDQLSHHKVNKNGVTVKHLSYEKLIELINIDSKIKV